MPEYTEQDVFTLSEEQGWTVETVGLLALQFIGQIDEMHQFVIFLQDVADVENTLPLLIIEED